MRGNLEEAREREFAGQINVHLEFRDQGNSDRSLRNSMLVFTISHTRFTISLSRDPLGKSLLKDLDLLIKIKESTSKETTVEKIKSAFAKADPQKLDYVLTPHRLAKAVFECSILKSVKRWQLDFGLYELLSFEIHDHDEIDLSLVDKLFNALPIVVNQTTCSCGNEGCFFDLLREAYDHFFMESELLTEGELDFDKVKHQFTQIWKQLSAKQRAVLNYLHRAFGNTPLINLYLLVPESDPFEYLYKMTFPYQPDSEDDMYVRKMTSRAVWYLQ